MNLNIFELIDGAAQDGSYTFYAERRYKPGHRPPSHADTLRDVIETHFLEHGLFTLRLLQDERWLNAIAARGDSDGVGSWKVQLDLCRLFLLPGRSPAAELTELRGLYAAMKPFFFDAAPVTEFSDVQICFDGERRPVVGVIRCRTRKTSRGPVDVDVLHTQRLAGMVAASPTLQAFVSKAAQVLSRVGANSWHSITEGQLYGQDESPWYKHYMSGSYVSNLGEVVSSVSGGVRIPALIG